MVFLTYSEFDELAELIDPFYRNFITVLVGTGMRFSEATALTVADVDFKTRSIRINKAWKMTGTSQRELGAPKTERSNRTVPMPPQVVEAIAPQVAGKKRTQLVFTNKQGNQLAHNVFHPVWQEAIRPFEEKTGIHPRIHDLRHTFASWCIQDKISLPVIQRSLGHESIQTTINIYGHLARADFDALASSIGMAWGNSLKAVEN
jgi:integrase